MNRKIMICILILCTLLLFSCREKITSESIKSGEDMISLEFAKENITKEITRTEVIDLIGEPLMDVGSGGYVYVYPMDDGNLLVLSFFSGPLHNAFIQSQSGDNTSFFD